LQDGLMIKNQNGQNQTTTMYMITKQTTYSIL